MPLADFLDTFPSLSKRLMQVRKGNRAGHAYLFVGDNMDLLEGFTKAWAQANCCMDITDEGDACGNCKNCKLYATDNYPVFLQVKPQSKSRRILIDEIRELQHQLNLSSSADQRKIGVIGEADCMGIQAQNAFLKTLEEPPAGTILILYSLQPRRLLDTIRSRCQVISLLRNSHDYSQVITTGIFQQLARLYPGAGAATGFSVANNIRKNLSELQAKAVKRIGKDVDERWNEAMAGNPVLRKKLEDQQLAKVAAEYLHLRRDVLEAIQTWFLLMHLLAHGAKEQEIPHVDILDEVRKNGQKIPNFSIEFIEKAVAEVEDLLNSLQANVNERMAVETFCLEVSKKNF